MLCGAGGKSGSVQVIASPVSLLRPSGPSALEKLVEGVGQELHTQSSAPRVRTVDGLKFECADAQTEISAPLQGKAEIRATSCAAVVHSYVVMWMLVGYSEAEWKRLVAGIDSVKVFKPLPLKKSVIAPHPSASAHGTIEPEFQTRLHAFIKAWLTDRKTDKTMAFFGRAAYSAPPLVGNYCDGWYRRGASWQVAAGVISENLMGVPKDFPEKTQAAAIFAAWKLFPPQWLSVSANDVAKEHYLVVRLDPDSLNRIFSGVFASSHYGKYLRNQVRKKKSAYWVVFPEWAPDGDLFVIFTFWQKTGRKWKITDVDVICQ